MQIFIQIPDIYSERDPNHLKSVITKTVSEKQSSILEKEVKLTKKIPNVPKLVSIQKLQAKKAYQVEFGGVLMRDVGELFAKSKNQLHDMSTIARNIVSKM